MKTNLKKIAIVVPVFNESKNLAELYRRLKLSTSSLPNYLWDYIFVNDGSSDDSYDVVQGLIRSDKRCRLLDLSRNFGKEVALTAGVFEAASPDAVICIDADLQHPPELIQDLVEKWELGAEVVVTIRKKTVGQPMLRNLASKLYHWIMSKFSTLEMIPQTTDFCLYGRDIIDAFKRVSERDRMFRAIMDWLGFRRATVEFVADARYEGSASYSFRALFSLGLGSLLSYSISPLRLTAYLGLVIALASGLLLSWILLSFVFSTGQSYTPLATFVVFNTFLMGLVLVAIGVVALYIGKISGEVANRPLYVVRERINFTSD